MTKKSSIEEFADTEPTLGEEEEAVRKLKSGRHPASITSPLSY